MSSKKWSHFLSIFLFLTAVSTRFLKIDWGNNFFFHPDENNMAWAIGRLSFSNLDPQFFAYGQFPLYLVFFPLKIFYPHTPIPFSAAVLGLRFSSAFFSLASLFVFYLLSQKIFSSPKTSFIFILLLIFTPGLIQLAHFGTTESLLILIFALSLYLSFRLYQKPSLKIILVASLVVGIGLASKITALVFTLPVFLALLLKFFPSVKFFLFSSIFLFTSLIFCFLFSPYNLLSWPQFLSAINYETSVATGTTPVFYTRQFISTTPYLFQFIKIFPFTNGLPVLIVSFVSLLTLAPQISQIKKRPLVLIVAVSVLVYFLYFGRLFTKWTRFMSPLFFIFPLISAPFLSRLHSSKLQKILIFFCLFRGLFFLNLYLHPDIRLTASSWMNQNLPPNSTLLSEAGNVVNLPLTNSNHLKIVNFDFFTLDSSPSSPSQLSQHLFDASYILVPSRRIFKNQNNLSFPFCHRYYTHLFDQSLGFSLIKTFYRSTSLLLDPEFAEETWTVFDHPTIRLFQKTSPQPFSFYHQLLAHD